MKKLLSLLLALVMLLSFAACANDDDTPPANEDGQQEEQNGSEAGTMNKLADIKAAGELVVGTSADYPPYEFHMEIDGVDTIVGFDIAIAQAFADELGVELKLVDMAFESLLISLQKGDFDLVMAGLTPDEERAKMTELLASGFADTFRRLHPDTADAYSWWSYRFHAREKNAGWRIDYFIVSERLMPHVVSASIRADVLGSDHCPVVLELDV